MAAYEGTVGDKLWVCEVRKYAEKFWGPTMTLIEVLAVWGITLNERQAQQLLEEMMEADRD